MNAMDSSFLKNGAPAPSRGVTLVELLVALSIGSFLIIGALQVATQSRHAFRVNESIARVQETAQFAMDTIEADLRMASNYGLLSRGDAVNGRAFADDPDEADPLDLLPAAAEKCGAGWVLDLTRPVEGSDNIYPLPSTCASDGEAQANSDTITIRRAEVFDVTTPPADGRLRIQTTRTQGEVFAGAAIPAGYDPLTSETHDLLVNTYYVAKDSELIPGVPTLRRKTLSVDSASPAIMDQEVAPGIENLQVQFGVDMDRDNAVDRYINPGSDILIPGEAAFDADARIMTARIWLVVRSVEREMGIADGRDYEPGNVDLGVPDDDYRRLQVSKTILLRNTRS